MNPSLFICIQTRMADAMNSIVWLYFRYPVAKNHEPRLPLLRREVNTLDIKSLEKEFEDALRQIMKSKGIEDPVEVTLSTSSGKSRVRGGGIPDGGRLSEQPSHEMTLYKVTATSVFAVHDSSEEHGPTSE